MIKTILASMSAVIAVAACSGAESPQSTHPESAAATVDGGPGAIAPDSSSLPKPGDPPTDDAGAPLPASWGQSQCAAATPPAGAVVGLETGNQLGAVVLKDCDGNDFPLTKICGASAAWVFVAHGWCPHCKLVTKNAESILAGYAGRNVAAVNVLLENAQGKAPTVADCKAWRDGAKLANVIALYDATGATKGLFEENATSLNVFLDKDRVIHAKAHTDVTAEIRRGIDEALK